MNFYYVKSPSIITSSNPLPTPLYANVLSQKRVQKNGTSVNGVGLPKILSAATYLII